MTVNGVKWKSILWEYAICTYPLLTRSSYHRNGPMSSSKKDKTGNGAKRIKFATHDSGKMPKERL